MTPSENAILRVVEFDANYLIQIMHGHTVLVTLGERSGSGRFDGFYLWEGTGLDDNDEESQVYLETFKGKVAEAVWPQAVKAAYARALDMIYPE